MATWWTEENIESLFKGRINSNENIEHFFPGVCFGSSEGDQCYIFVMTNVSIYFLKYAGLFKVENILEILRFPYQEISIKVGAGLGFNNVLYFQSKSGWNSKMEFNKFFKFKPRASMTDWNQIVSKLKSRCGLDSTNQPKETELIMKYFDKLKFRCRSCNNEIKWGNNICSNCNTAVLKGLPNWIDRIFGFIIYIIIVIVLFLIVSFIAIKIFYLNIPVVYRMLIAIVISSISLKITPGMSFNPKRAFVKIDISKIIEKNDKREINTFDFRPTKWGKNYSVYKDIYDLLIDGIQNTRTMVEILGFFKEDKAIEGIHEIIKNTKDENTMDMGIRSLVRIGNPEAFKILNNFNFNRDKVKNIIENPIFTDEDKKRLKEIIKYDNIKISQNNYVDIPQNSIKVYNGLLDVNIGIETIGNLFTPLLSKGTKVPCEISQTFSTAVDGQKAISIHVLQGSGLLVSDVNVKSIGKFDIIGIQNFKKGIPQIKVIFKVKDTGDFFIEAFDLTTNLKYDIVKK